MTMTLNQWMLIIDCYLLDYVGEDCREDTQGWSVLYELGCSPETAIDMMLEDSGEELGEWQ